MFPVVRIGPLALQTAGLVVLLGFWLALELASRQGHARDFGKRRSTAPAFSARWWESWRPGWAMRPSTGRVYRQDPLGLLALSPQALHPGRAGRRRDRRNSLPAAAGASCQGQFWTWRRRGWRS
jgi:hypothetical protein